MSRSDNPILDSDAIGGYIQTPALVSLFLWIRRIKIFPRDLKMSDMDEEKVCMDFYLANG